MRCSCRPSANSYHGAAEIERWPRHRGQTEHDFVEVLRAFHVGDADGDVM